MTWFNAKKAGTCSSCGAPVAEGDRMWAVRRGFYTCEFCGISREESATGDNMGQMESSVVESLKAFPPEAMGSALAQSMIYLSRQLDHDEVNSRDVPNFSKEIRQALAQLEIAYPATPEDDETDRAQKRREKRLKTGLDEKEWDN
jgi:hypothetical protein